MESITLEQVALLVAIVSGLVALVGGGVGSFWAVKLALTEMRSSMEHIISSLAEFKADRERSQAKHDAELEHIWETLSEHEKILSAHRAQLAVIESRKT